MGDSKGKCTNIDIVEHNNPPKIFQPNWFDIWISLMALPQFEMRTYDNIGLKLVKIRALPKCEEKGITYIKRMCRDWKIQWLKDFSQQRTCSYEDSYKRKTLSATLNTVPKVEKKKIPKSTSKVKVNHNVENTSVIRQQVTRRSVRRWCCFPGIDKKNNVILRQVKRATTANMPNE